MTSSSHSPNWFVRFRPTPRPGLRFFCFPYAGGGANVYRSWSETVPDSVELLALQLPGRGARLVEEPFNRMRPIVQSLVPAILPYLDRPFAFFGHSMGSLVSFELARELRRRYGLLPVHLFVSGRIAPDAPRLRPPIHAMPDAEFLDELGRYNGTPRALLGNQELMQLMMPTLRADFAVCETYECDPQPPLPCPITAFAGTQDEHAPASQVDGWREHTTADFTLHQVPGDHFFLDGGRPIMLQLLSRQLVKHNREWRLVQ